MNNFYSKDISENKVKKIGYALSGISIVIGMWPFWSMGIIFVVLAGIITGCVIAKNAHNDEEKKFLRRAFTIALALSFAVCVIHFYLAGIIKKNSDLIGDAASYSNYGAYVADVLTNGKIKYQTENDTSEIYWNYNRYNGKLPNFTDYGHGFITLLYGYIYASLGYMPLTVKLFNSFLGIIGCFLIYFWTRDAFGEIEAKITLILILFEPSRFLWAVSALKDTLVFFSFSLILFMFVKLNKNIGFSAACIVLTVILFGHKLAYILFLTVIVIIFFVKKDIVLLCSFVFIKLAYTIISETRFFLSTPLLFVLGISLCTFLTRGKLILVAICMVALSSVLLDDATQHRLKDLYLLKMNEIINGQRDKANAGGESSYRIYPDRFYDRSSPTAQKQPLTYREFIISLLRGMSYYFLWPFPWSLKNPFQLFGFFQSVGIYVLFPFIMIGIKNGLRYHWRETFPYFVFMLTMVVIYSLSIGNAGTLFRHRDMAMPFFIAFGGVGLSKVFSLGRISLNKLTVISAKNK